MFKNPADRLPVLAIAALSVLDLAVYLTVDGVWPLLAYWLLLIIPKGVVCAWSHHHQHAHTFRHTALNRAYELIVALQTGITTNLWVLHHNLGHHLNFMDQTADESAWRRPSGVTMGPVEYTLTVAGTSYYRAYLVGRRHPKHLRPFLVWTAVTVAVVAALVAFRPLAGLLVYVVPMVTSLLFTSLVTYDHHRGLDTQDQFAASYNVLNPVYNLLTGNLGYHTAHHHRQAVHWSKLPELHARIEHLIPPHLYRRSLFDRWRRLRPRPAPRTAAPLVAPGAPLPVDDAG